MVSTNKKKKRVKTIIPSRNGALTFRTSPIKKGFVYLVVILDLESGEVVGSCVLEHMEHSLVLQALRQALERYSGKEGMLFHSDRGRQYAAWAVKEMLKSHTIHKSQGKEAYDNAVMEGFFSILKKELM